jgi:acetyl-CoA acetyltransferase
MLKPETVEKELGLNRDTVNLLLELRRRGKTIGLATACIGGGQGMAAIVESV